MSGTTPSPGSEPNEGTNPYAQPSERAQDAPSGAQPPPAWSGPPPESAPARSASTPPQSVVNAVRLMYLGAALTALQLILFLAFADRDDLREAIRDASPELSETALDGAVTVSVTITVVVLVLAIALWLWLAWKNRQGRSWARIVATVLGALNVAYVLYVISAGGLDTITLLINLVSLALAAVILWFLWRPESSAYIARVSQNGS